ncbi:MAG: DUF1963 domain-containing protein [Planctomycetes bacterium]|nr:DUF1963 domain-containing protein [Planctomycetota bacterium]
MPPVKSPFGGYNPDSGKDRNIEDHLDYLNTLREPAIALLKSGVKNFSRVGGLPAMPEDVPWPEWNGSPLAFLCQLDLSELPEGCVRNGLPATGILYFFYDQAQEAWGFDPKDKGSWRVIYTDKASKECAERAAPEGLSSDCVYNEKSVVLAPVETYPDWQDDRVDLLSLTERQFDQYIDLCASVFLGNPEHHLFGHPSPVQGNDMDLECQLVSNGLCCGDGTEYSSSKAQRLEPGRADWVLLFQLDTDDDTGMMWGDCGMLYFWIKKADLEEKRFENCWMILQCG